MGDGLTVERHQDVILESRRFCFQQLLDFEQLLPPARQSRRDQRSRSSVRNRLETEAAYLRKGSAGTMGVWSLGQQNHEETSGAAKSVLAGAPGAAPFLGSMFTGDYG